MLLERDLIFLGWDWAQRYHGPCPGLVRSQQMEEDGPPRRTDNRPYMVGRSPQADGTDKWFDLDTSRARIRRRASSTSWGNQAGRRRRICLSATHPVSDGAGAYHRSLTCCYQGKKAFDIADAWRKHIH